MPPALPLDERRVAWRPLPTATRYVSTIRAGPSQYKIAVKVYPGSGAAVCFRERQKQHNQNDVPQYPRFKIVIHLYSPYVWDDWTLLPGSRHSRKDAHLQHSYTQQVIFFA